MRERVRAVVVCEDQRQRSFLIRLLGRLGVSPLYWAVAPGGEGSAEQWVRKQLLKEVRAHRSQAAHQVNLTLVVMTDGDRFGVNARKVSLDAELTGAGEPQRRADERILYLVPTWSIETWVAWLCGVAGELGSIDESTAYKRHAPFMRLWDAEHISTKLAALAWTSVSPDEATAVPSLADARDEVARRMP
jgi:hypothetical protein